MVKTKLCEAHACEDHALEGISTPDSPYHYVNSGLENVYLVGVKYSVCEKCGLQSADIPALAHLLTAIARTLVAKSAPLTGEQVRFLRKRLHKSSKDFARIMSMTPGRLSTLESGTALAAPRDKLVRMIYKLLSGDLTALSLKPEKIERWLTSIHGSGASEVIIATWQRNRQWRVESRFEAA